MLLITGSQRSGTSLVAKYCQSMGYNLGSDFWDDNINAGLESEAICKFYSEAMGMPNLPFKNFPYSQENYPKLEDIESKIQKSSFLMTSPDFVDLWYHRRQNQDKFLILTRNSIEIVRSKSHSPERIEIFGEQDSSLDQDIEQIGSNWYESYMRIMEYGIDHHVLKFPEFAVDGAFELRSVLEGFTENIAFSAPIGLTKWRKMYDPSKITQSIFNT